jgi:hypothetical protein
VLMQKTLTKWTPLSIVRYSSKPWKKWPPKSWPPLNNSTPNWAK